VSQNIDVNTFPRSVASVPRTCWTYHIAAIWSRVRLSTYSHEPVTEDVQPKRAGYAATIISLQMICRTRIDIIQKQIPHVCNQHVDTQVKLAAVQKIRLGDVSARQAPFMSGF